MPTLIVPHTLEERELTDEAWEHLKQALLAGRFAKKPEGCLTPDDEWMMTWKKAVGLLDQRCPTLDHLLAKKCKLGDHLWGDTPNAWNNTPSSMGLPGRTLCQCTVVLARLQEIIRLHPAIDGALLLTSSPLFQQIGRNTIVTCHNEDKLWGHIRTVSQRLICLPNGSRWSTRADLVEAARAKAWGDDDDDDGEDEDSPHLVTSVYAWVRGPDMLLLAAGVGKPGKTDFIKEALLGRRDKRKATWLVEFPGAPLPKNLSDITQSWDNVELV